MKYLRLPPIADDPRFDSVEPEIVLTFLTLYQMSGDRGLRGRVPEPQVVAEALADRTFVRYYSEQMWELESVGLLSYVAGEGWCIPDFSEWNPEWDDPAVRMRASRARKAEQLGLGLSPDVLTPSPLNAEQSEGFGRVWYAYPADRRGSKLECQREYRDINPDEAMVQRMVDAIEAYKTRDLDWARGAIPQFRRFLHGRHWENAPDANRTNLVRLVPQTGDRRGREDAEKQQAMRAMRERFGLAEG